MNFRKHLLTLFIIFFSLTDCYSALKIDITEGNIDPIPIAILDFQSRNIEVENLGKKISSVVRNNLDRTGLFKHLRKETFIVENINFNKRPDFSDWRITTAQVLIHGRILAIDNQKISLEFRLWDIFQEKQMVAQQLQTNKDNWRRIAHVISDIIYSRITGESGYFDTRIVYISESGLKTKRKKRLAIMDQDGANHKFLTDGSYLALTPRFSPASQTVAYLSYFQKVPRIFLLDLETGKQKVLGDFPGMTFSPRFSPNGQNLIMSLAKNGNTDLYQLKLSNMELTRLTRYKGIDTAPSYSPDGKNIVFESDRSGRQQIYTMNLKSKKIKRISFGNGKYATPVWSPRGDLVAFTKFLNGEFFIGVMYKDGKGERVVYKAYLVEGPTWAPNGRVLAFYSQNKNINNVSNPRIKIIDLTGRNLRELVTPSDASDPAWSGLLP